MFKLAHNLLSDTKLTFIEFLKMPQIIWITIIWILISAGLVFILSLDPRKESD